MNTPGAPRNGNFRAGPSPGSVRPSGMQTSTAVKHTRGMTGDSIYHQQTTLDQVNSSKELEKLRKELDRKDARNANVTTEMQSLRNKLSNLERELRLLSGTFEKCNNERQRLANEVGRNKEYTDKLELQLVRLGNVQGLTSQVDELHSDNEHLSAHNRDLNHNLALREERIRVLEKELEAHQRSVELKVDFERRHGGGGRSAGGGTGSMDGAASDAAMRSLYYELGKRQTDAHSLAVALASSNQDLQACKESLHGLGVQHADLQSEYGNLRGHAQALTQQSVAAQDEIAQLMERLSQMKTQAVKYSEQANMCAQQLQTERVAWDKLKAEHAEKMSELTSAAQASAKENSRLKARVENMQSSLTHVERARAHAEERLATESHKMDAERGAAAEKIRVGSDAKKEVVVLRQQVKDILLGKDNFNAQLNTLRQDLEDVRVEKMRMQGDLEATRAREAELLQDRESTVKALQQTIEATHALSSRAADEKVRRVTAEDQRQNAEDRASAAEKLAESLHRAREHVSDAVLDALQKEKAKNALLEQRLQAALLSTTTTMAARTATTTATTTAAASKDVAAVPTSNASAHIRSQSQSQSQSQAASAGDFQNADFAFAFDSSAAFAPAFSPAFAAFDADELFAPPLPPRTGTGAGEQSLEVRFSQENFPLRERKGGAAVDSSSSSSSSSSGVSSVRSSGSGAEVLRASQAFLNSSASSGSSGAMAGGTGGTAAAAAAGAGGRAAGDTSGSTAGNVKAELSRLRQELSIMEASTPANANGRF